MTHNEAENKLIINTFDLNDAIASPYNFTIDAYRYGLFTFDDNLKSVQSRRQAPQVKFSINLINPCDLADVSALPINNIDLLLTYDIGTVTIDYEEFTHSEPIDCGVFDYIATIDS